MHLSLYKESLALLTDLYQLTMAYGYWKVGLEKKEAVFHLTFRKNPFQGGFTIAAGLETAIDFLKQFRYTTSDLDYLATIRDPANEPLFSQEFLHYLSTLRITCDIDAMAEGTVVFPQEPLLRVKGPLIQAQLLESPLLNLINFPTLIATKAARITLAAKGDPVVDFGLRRAQGIDGAVTASRAAFIGGCQATTNMLAGKLFGIPVRGTQAHSWVMAFPDEESSFQAFVEAVPGNRWLLVDTYNTLKGVERAISVAKKLQREGKQLLGIRLDSGDLAYLSIRAREMLDAAGFSETKIFASNELDETVIAELKTQGAKIDVWGVGTKLVTAKDQPALDGVYKLSAIRDPGEKWQYKLKLSEQLIKISNPGVLQVRRFQSGGEYVADMIFDEEEEVRDVMIDPLDPTKEKEMEKDMPSEDLLKPIFRSGKCVYTPPPLQEVREKMFRELQRFQPGVKRFLNPHQYVVGMESHLYERKTALIKAIRRGKS